MKPYGESEHGLARWMAALLLGMASAASAENSPVRILYQGSLAQNGSPANGPVSMVLRLTTADGSVQYWTSGSTTVPVSNGAFRYPLGTPNESSFAAIPWYAAMPFVELTVNGTLLTPRDPLLHVPYALVADGLAPGAVLQGPTLDMAAKRITGVGAPVSASDAATKAYVDTASAGGSGSAWSLSGNNLSNTNGGNVGIGTASPTSLLEARMDQNAGTSIKLTNAGAGNSAYAQYTLSNGTDVSALSLMGKDSPRYMQLFNSAPNGVYFDQYNASGDFAFRTGTNLSEKLRITNGGDVGVGTPSPKAALHLKSPNNVPTQLRLGSVGQDTFEWGLGREGVTNGRLGIYEYDGSSHERLSIMPGGYVGIGTAGPSAALHVKSLNTEPVQLRFGSLGQETYEWGIGREGVTNGRLGIYEYNGSANERLSIMSGGNVGIGTSSPRFKLDIQGGQINAAGGLCIAGDCKSAWPTGIGGTSITVPTIFGSDAANGTLTLQSTSASGGNSSDQIAIRTGNGSSVVPNLAPGGVPPPRLSSPSNARFDTYGRYIQTVGSPFFTPDGAFTAANPLVIPGQPFAQDSSFVISGAYQAPAANGLYASMLAVTNYTSAPGSDIISVLGTGVATAAGAGADGVAGNGIAYANGSNAFGAEFGASAFVPNAQTAALMLEAGGAYPVNAYERYLSNAAATGARYGIEFIVPTGNFNPFQPDGTIMGTADRTGSVVVDYGIDLQYVAVNQAAFRSRNFLVDGAGNLAANSGAKPGGGSWDTWSDARLKNVGELYRPGLQEIRGLKPVYYRYKKDNALGLSDNARHVGFVAQEVQKLIPEAVSVDGKGYLQLNNDPILWAMLNAIQEIDQQNKKLREENETLSRRVENLERKR